MTLSDYASLGTVIGAIAVVASLIYLALQVRLAHRVQQAFMHQARVERVTSASLAFLQPEVAALIAKAGTESPDLTSAEVIQLIYFLRIQITAHEDAVWQAQAGFLDPSALQTTTLTTRRILSNPSMRAAWRLVRGQIPSETLARFDQIEAETPLIGPVDWAKAWKKAYADVKAGDAPPGGS